mgnify:CR=1 FL=1|tara:strand:- start:29 stop:709 length:681 start_codon:yes stop_codon:yes gene_type:complete
MINLSICSHREWSNSIYDELSKTYKDKNIKIDKFENNEELIKSLDSDKKFDAILFIGWNDILPKEIVDNNLCICLHPSLLPKYRGGSPIQHQMINGEKYSGVTIFKMDEGIDTGPIFFQEKYLLEDLELNDVFEEMIKIGLKGFSKLINVLIDGKEILFEEQDHNKASSYKRRKPEESEIKIDDFDKFTSKQLSNKINSLQAPYPNAYIKCKDGTRLFIKSSWYEE